VKRILRDNANFGVLEGLMTVLIGEPMTIVEILESEANQDTADDKFNRVDIKAKNAKGDIIIVEVQLTRELYYLERILYGVSKAITEHIKLGSRYDQVKKVYSINILYFDLGRGKDYLYHGTTNFIGVHTGDTLEVNTREDDIVRMRTPASIFPEYYLIRVNQFNDVAKTPIEEWMDYLKNEHIREDTTVPGLQEAREKLAYLRMTPEDRAIYDRHVENMMYQNEALGTARTEGWDEGRKEGIKEGRKEGIKEGRKEGKDEANRENASRMKADGMPAELIAKYTGLTVEDINSL
jgi:hypothetical protein